MEQAFPVKFINIDARTLEATEDFSMWTDDDYAMFEMFVEKYIEHNVEPVYEALVRRMNSDIPTLPLSDKEKFAVAIFVGAPMVVNANSTNLGRGKLALQSTEPILFEIDTKGRLVVLTKRSSCEEPERNGD